MACSIYSHVVKSCTDRRESHLHGPRLDRSLELGRLMWKVVKWPSARRPSRWTRRGFVPGLVEFNCYGDTGREDTAGRIRTPRGAYGQTIPRIRGQEFEGRWGGARWGEHGDSTYAIQMHQPAHHTRVGLNQVKHATSAALPPVGPECLAVVVRSGGVSTGRLRPTGGEWIAYDRWPCSVVWCGVCQSPRKVEAGNPARSPCSCP